jgi:hypothetical protein
MISKPKLWFVVFIFISSAFLVFPLIVLAQTPIPCGQAMAGSISAPGESDSYSFTGSVGNVVTVRVSNTSGGYFAPYAELYNPSGVWIGGDPHQINITLAVTGTYKILLRDANNLYTGDYVLYWQRMNNPCNVVSSVACGQVVTGTIGTGASPPPWRVYTFSASANDVVTLRAINTSGGFFSPYMELYNPSGVRIARSSYCQIFYVTLAVTGTYKILFSDDYNTYGGDYVLTWQRLNNPCNVVSSVACGQVVTGTIGTGVSPPPWRVYTFSASANDVVTLRTASPSLGIYPWIELYDPSGVYLDSGNQIDVTLAVTGAYKILLSDLYAGSGDYVLTWQRVKNPCNAVTISCGQVLSGSVSVSGEIDAYKFTGSVGDVVTIRVSNTGGYLIPHAELYDPSGVQIVSEGALTVAGSYTILVRDTYNTSGGDYVLTWERMNNPCNVVANLSCGQVVTGTIGTGVSPPPWRVYTFSALANDVVTIRTRKTSGGSFDPYMELYNPSGIWIGGRSSQIDMTLAVTGTYKILLGDAYNTYGGDYVLTWERMNNPCNAVTISCGQVLSGSVSVAGEIDAYKFTGSIGDVVTIRVSNTGGYLIPHAELYDPSGVRIVGTYPYYQIDVTLPVTGTYTILVRDTNNLYTGDYVLTWQRLNNPCNVVTISCGQVLSGSVSVAGEIDAYKFTGSSGDAVTIRTINTSGGSFDPYMDLYDPSGVRIGGPSSQIDMTLAVTGSYTILVRDYNNIYGGSYTLKFQKNNNSCPEVTVTAPNGGEII